MRKMKALGATVVVVGLAMLPAVGAIVHLGLALGAIDRMHASRGAAEGKTTREVIGTYEVDPVTLSPGIRLHEVQLLHRRN
jgi:hypothetical protein